MRSAPIIAVGVSLLLSSCIAFQVSRHEVDAPVEVEPFESFKEGKTTIGEVAEFMGPPDYMVFGWDEEGDLFTRFDYVFAKGRSSDVVVTLPLEELRKINNILTYFSVVISAIRGETPYQDELERLGVTFESSYSSVNQSRHRLSEKRSTHNGRAVSMNDITGRQDLITSKSGGIPSVFVPLELMDEGRGSDRLRLVFDKMGILTLKEMRKGSPDTNVGAQITDTLLQ